MGAMVLHCSSRLLPHSAPHKIWIQKTKRAQIKLIKLISDSPFPEPSVICLSNVSINEPPPGSPKTAHMETVSLFQSLLFSVSRIPHKKALLIKTKFHPSLEGPKKAASPMFPKTGPLWRQTLISRALLSITLRVSSKEPSFQVPLIELPQTEMLHFQTQDLLGTCKHI